MGRWPSWRATLRMARRDAWRAKGRSFLVAFMIGLPVAAAAAVSVLYQSATLDPVDVVASNLGPVAQARIDDSYGDRLPLVQSVDGQSSGSTDDGSGTTATPAAIPPDDAGRGLPPGVLPAGARVVPKLVTSSSVGLRTGNRNVQVTVQELAYDDPGVAGLVQQLTGRAPRTADEIAITAALASHAGLAAGDQVQLTGLGEDARPVTIVGTVRNWTEAGQREVFADPGALIPAAWAADRQRTFQYWYVAGPPLTWPAVLKLNDAGLTALSRSVILDPPPSDQVPCVASSVCGSGGTSGTTVAVVAVVVGMVLLQIALLAGPAMAVGARRNQRTLALLAASGGEKRHLRSFVLGSALVVGVVGSAAAAALGAGIGAVAVVLIRRYGNEPLPRIDVHLTDLAGLVLVGGATAVAAALVPARAAARIDLVAALTGRRGQAAPRLRVPVIGLLVAAAGVALGLYGAGAHRPLFVLAGLALGELGMIAAVGAVVSLAARFSGRLPLSPRLALRDAARQRARTAPAVAAVMAAVAGSVTGLLYVATQDGADRASYSASAALGVVSYEPGTGEALDWDAVTSLLRSTLPIRDTATLQAAVRPGNGELLAPGYQLSPDPALACPNSTYDYEVNGEPSAALQRTWAADPRCRDTFVQDRYSHSDMVDDGSAARILLGGGDPGIATALAAGKVVVFDRGPIWTDGTVHLQRSAPMDSTTGDPEGPVVTAPAYLSGNGPGMYGTILPASLVKPLGLELVTTGVVASTTHLPSSAEQEAASARLQDLTGSAYVQVERGYVSNYGLGLLALLIAAAVVTLGGTFTAVGLAVAESRADVATLAAVGAGPGLRRRLVAAQAGTIAGLGVALGVAAGGFAGWLLIRLRQPTTGSADLITGATSDGGWSLVVPWGHLAIVVLGVPLLAVLVGFLGVRSRLPMTRRLGQ